MFGAANQTLAVNTSFLKDGKTVVDFLKAYAEATEFYAKNPDKAVEFIAQYSGAPKDVLAESVKHHMLDVRVDVNTAVHVAKQGPV